MSPIKITDLDDAFSLSEDDMKQIRGGVSFNYAKITWNGGRAAANKSKGKVECTWKVEEGES